VSINFQPRIENNATFGDVTKTAESTASSALLNLFERQIVEARDAIKRCESVLAEDKIDAITAMEDAKRAAEKGDHRELAENLVKALEVASKVADVAKKVIPLAGTVIGLLPK